MLLQELENKQLINPPPWMTANTMSLVIMGSIAYGVSEDTSDFDCYGFCIPPKDHVFPYAQKLFGFDHVSTFEQYQQHKVKDKPAGVPDGITYDMVIKELKKRGEI